MKHLRSPFLERMDNDTVEEVRRDDDSDKADHSGDGERHAKDVKVEDGDHEREQHDSCVPQAAIETPALVPEPKSTSGVHGTEEGHGVEVHEHQSCKPSKQSMLEHGHEDQKNVDERHGHEGKQLGGLNHLAGASSFGFGRGHCNGIPGLVSFSLAEKLVGWLSLRSGCRGVYIGFVSRGK
jgi:hypothetical protein